MLNQSKSPFLASAASRQFLFPADAFFPGHCVPGKIAILSTRLQLELSVPIQEFLKNFAAVCFSDKIPTNTKEIVVCAQYYILLRLFFVIVVTESDIRHRSSLRIQVGIVTGIPLTKTVGFALCLQYTQQGRRKVGISRG